MVPQDRSGLIQVFEHLWPTDVWVVAQLAMPLEQIAARNGLVLQTWDEEGLGQFTGCGGRLPSGVVVRLEESAALVSSLEKRGPALFADAADVHRVGIEKLVEETLSALNLSRSDVEARNDEPTPAELANIKRHADAYRKER